jgi:ubiquinone/menaquinone biosynthesis C-methylase UbiE
MFLKRSDPFGLVVGMTSVKMGDRLLQIGCAHGGRLGAIAVRVGLSGRAVAVVPDEASAARARKGAADAGVLVEIEIAPASQLPLEDQAFDLAILDDTGGLLGSMRVEDRATAIGELHRVLRPGGRAMIIGVAARSGLGALLSPPPPGALFAASGDATVVLQSGGFTAVRTLAEREGLVFVEGIRARVGRHSMADG